MQYMFFSIASLYFLGKYERSRGIYHILLSIMLAMLATFTRIIGICLLASIVFTLLGHYKKIWKAALNRTGKGSALFAGGSLSFFDHLLSFCISCSGLLEISGAVLEK